MNVVPLHDRVVLLRIEGEQQTSSGLYIPDTAQEKQARGEVKAVGPGKVSDKGEVRALTVTVGQEVLFSKYSGTDIKVDGEELVILREDDILAIIKN